MQRRLQEDRTACERMSGALSHLNPEATLARGYSIVRDSAGNIVRASSQLQAGDEIRLRFGSGSASGHIDCTE
jgi:exodeoxyribonuclease VII large subunit